jgi:3',5'-cyclic AMP phosphodiesterase CpdA
MTVLAALVADIRAHAPDHVAMTGDVAHIGLPKEFDAAIPFMESLGPRDHVSFVPGNHDAYTEGSAEACLRALGTWMESDDGAAGFPWLKVRGEVALLGLNSGVVTPPFNATGHLGQEQIDRAELLLHYAKSRGLARVILIHHPPHQGGARSGRNLTDAASFEAMLARAGADLVLHGHNHATSLAWRDGPEQPIPIIGVASASGRDDGRHEKAAWHRVQIGGNKSQPIITVTRRSLMANGGFGDDVVLGAMP